MRPSHLPDGYESVTPYLVVEDPRPLIDFLTKALDGTVEERFEGEGGTVRHAEVRVGTSIVMMGMGGGEHPPMSSMLYVYVDDVDAWYRRALEAGVESIQEPADMPYGDRTAAVRGPQGNAWYLAQRVETLTGEEIAERMQAGS